MRYISGARRERAHLVTEARRSLSEDIAFRQRRYLIMMGFRVVFFVLAVLLFVNGAGWYAAIPAVGAIVIPYFAVVFANGGRELTNSRGFRAYEPNLPVRYVPPPSDAAPRAPGASAPGASAPGGLAQDGLAPDGAGSPRPTVSQPGGTDPAEATGRARHREP